MVGRHDKPSATIRLGPIEYHRSGRCRGQEVVSPPIATPRCYLLGCPFRQAPSSTAGPITQLPAGGEWRNPSPSQRLRLQGGARPANGEQGSWQVLMRQVSAPRTLPSFPHCRELLGLVRECLAYHIIFKGLLVEGGKNPCLLHKALAYGRREWAEN